MTIENKSLGSELMGKVREQVMEVRFSAWETGQRLKSGDIKPYLNTSLLMGEVMAPLAVGVIVGTPSLHSPSDYGINFPASSEAPQSKVKVECYPATVDGFKGHIQPGGYLHMYRKAGGGLAVFGPYDLSQERINMGVDQIAQSFVGSGDKSVVVIKGPSQDSLNSVNGLVAEEIRKDGGKGLANDPGSIVDLVDGGLSVEQLNDLVVFELLEPGAQCDYGGGGVAESKPNEAPAQPSVPVAASTREPAEAGQNQGTNKQVQPTPFKTYEQSGGTSSSATSGTPFPVVVFGCGAAALLGGAIAVGMRSKNYGLNGRGESSGPAESPIQEPIRRGLPAKQSPQTQARRETGPGLKRVHKALKDQELGRATPDQENLLTRLGIGKRRK